MNSAPLDSVLVHPQFDPVALAIGPLAIHWYGLMYLLAFAAFFILGRQQIRLDPQSSGMTLKDLDDLLFLGAVGVVLGGRLGYVFFYQPDYYLAHPAEILAVWQGGMAFHGGLLGVILVMIWMAWARRHLGQGGSFWNRFWALADFVAPLVPLGLAAGRMGNFINGELWGRVADPHVFAWAMVFPQSGSDLPRHPSQLYQFFGEGLILFLILFWLARRPQPRGRVASSFLLGYGLLRFLAEFGREPDSFLGLLQIGERLGLSISLSMGQWLSLPMILFGLIGIRVFRASRP